MTLLLTAAALAARKQALTDPEALGGLAGSLQRELHAALDVAVPDGKSRLTRSGGRCPACTVLLSFDPRQPLAHTCPSCGLVYREREHHEWWLMNSHLWTAEQCTRAAVLGYLLDDEVAARRADEILIAYADRYLQWPNRDNALGPTRPFFSTYLESIWLLHLSVALDLRETAAPSLRSTLGSRVRDRLIEPSARLIASFDEGRSNRQVWHAAALLAASRLLGDATRRARAALSLVTLLRDGLHTDGSWYEGENYHLFAHRGLLSAVTLAEQAAVELPGYLLQRFEAGFAVPFRTVLPDGSFPARRDSQYGVTLRQYRTADWIECGLARHDTPELRSALAFLYADWTPPGDTGRRASTADAERNQPGVRLTRADCSWRALLLARLDLPPLDGAEPRSELLEGQGLAIFRRDGGRFWVGLDYGDPGAGHGHPDRLNLVIATRFARWLDDVGTGSYTAPTLSWYRSSMAHNAPVVNGMDQGAARGVLIAYDERDDAGWVSASFTEPHSGVRFVRTVVVTRDHVLDELTWTAAHPVVVDVPMQVQMLNTDDDRWAPFQPNTTQDDRLGDAVARELDAGEVVLLTLRGIPSPTMSVGDTDASVFVTGVHSQSAATLWCAATIGPPAGQPHGLTSLRQQGLRGRSTRVIAAPTSVTSIGTAGGVDVVAADGSITRHQRTSSGWQVVLERGTQRSTLLLGGLRPPPAARFTPVVVAPARRSVTPGPDATLEFALGEAHYRPTEESWSEAGEPTAVVSVRHRTGRIDVAVQVSLHRPTRVAAPCDVNPLDNELADVNSDGVQLHWRSAVSGSWIGALAVPAAPEVRLAAVAGALDGLQVASLQPPRGADGFGLRFTLPWPDASLPFEFDCCINERPAGRERRRGQLVLSGANGESAYLRGARQGPDRAITVLLDQPAS